MVSVQGLSAFLEVSSLPSCIGSVVSGRGLFTGSMLVRDGGGGGMCWVDLASLIQLPGLHPKMLGGWQSGLGSRNPTELAQYSAEVSLTSAHGLHIPNYDLLAWMKKPKP